MFLFFLASLNLPSYIRDLRVCAFVQLCVHMRAIDLRTSMDNSKSLDLLLSLCSNIRTIATLYVLNYLNYTRVLNECFKDIFFKTKEKIEGNIIEFLFLKYYKSDFFFA